MKRRGMMLVEFLVYLTLFTLLSTMTASWISRLWGAFMTQSSQRTGALHIYSAHDCIVHDIRNCISIISCQENRCIINTFKGEVGWFKDDDKLYRTQGIYSTVQKKGAKHTKNIVAQNIHDFTCNTEHSGVHFSLQSKSLRVENTVTIRNRELSWKKKNKKESVDRH